MHRTVLLLALAGCGGSQTFDLEVTGPSGVVAPGSTLALTIYGYDELVADASASVIHTQREPLTQLPIQVMLAFPDDAAAGIDQGFGPVAEDRARFYLIAYGDLDDDGQICPGELIQDYDDSGPYSFGPEGPEPELTIPMRVIEDDLPCRPAFP